MSVITTASNLRLPGVYFLPPLRGARPGLPPLDVAGFVGFCERGPVHTPVPVEDLQTYRDVFGGDLALAREAGGQTLFAHLPGAVTAFFTNGGRRCYVVRVAGKDAKPTCFRVPGMVTGRGPAGPMLVSIEASSTGRWSEQLRLGARLRATPLPPTAFTIGGERTLSWFTGSAPQAIQKGDLLRLTAQDERQWVFPVQEIRTPPHSTPQTPLTLEASAVWPLLSRQPVSPPREVRRAQRLTLDSMEPFQLVGLLSAADRMHELKLEGPGVDKLQRGDVLWLELADGTEILFPVTDLRLELVRDSPPRHRRVARAREALELPGPCPSLASPPPVLRRVERLRFDLALSERSRQHFTISELAFNTGHPRFWGDAALLESSPRFRRAAVETPGERLAAAARLFRNLRSPMRSRLAEDETPDPELLSGLLAPAAAVEDEDPPGDGRGETAASLFLPLGMPEVLSETEFLGALEADIGSDDLDRFSASLFLDPALAASPGSPSVGPPPTTPAAIAAAALDRYYVHNIRLRGLHTLLVVDEVALVAIPDAVHREWKPPEPPTSEVSSPPLPSPPPPPPEGFHDCPPAGGGVPPEVLVVSPPVAEDRPGRPERPLPLLKPLDEYASEHLLTLHHALLQACEGRADMLAVLSLPLHFEKRQCIQWQEDLRTRLGLPRRRLRSEDAREIADLSYAAVYHPWLFVADTSASDRLRAIPGDGAICGMIAARERERGVWIAPANVSLQGVLGLAPPLSTADAADLFDLQFNIVSREARDFRVMSAHTQSDERALLQLSVRRLMILLRKVALDRGMDYVFRPNNEHFREGVRSSLEEMLRFMFERGAFAGATPQESFQVVTDASVNTPQSVDLGRFIAEIQVAPSQPMEFITVLLTRVGNDQLQVTEV